jgi:hypothetical protein
MPQNTIFFRWLSFDRNVWPQELILSPKFPAELAAWAKNSIGPENAL